MQSRAMGTKGAATSILCSLVRGIQLRDLDALFDLFESLRTLSGLQAHAILDDVDARIRPCDRVFMQAALDAFEARAEKTSLECGNRNDVAFIPGPAFLDRLC